MELKEISGIGEKTIVELNKLNIFNVEDLVTYYPKRYFVLKRSDIRIANNGDKVIIDGIVSSIPIYSNISNKLKKISFRLQSNNYIYNIIVFNQVYLCKTLKIGDQIIVIGKFDKYKNTITVSEVRSGRIDNVRIESIYAVNSGFNRKTLAKLINKVLNEKIIIDDYIPLDIIKKYNFPDKLWCVKEIHNPSSSLNYRRALQRLKYEEFYNYFLKIKKMKALNSVCDKCIRRDVDNDKLDDFINGLPFELTKDQIDTIDCIKKDLITNRRMNRLVQGDVGSGKTIVAFIAVYINFLSGYQSAMMVPTEILANQHYANACSLFEKNGLRVCLLTSSIKNKNNYIKLLKKVNMILLLEHNL